jgi:hypothetical protein
MILATLNLNCYKSVTIYHRKHNRNPVLQLGMVVHACNLSTLEAKARESGVPGQAVLYSKTLFSPPQKRKKKGESS